MTGEQCVLLLLSVGFFLLFMRTRQQSADIAELLSRTKDIEDDADYKLLHEDNDIIKAGLRRIVDLLDGKSPAKDKDETEDT